MDLNLRGKIALITGASRGLGFSTARLLSQEGALLAINSRDKAQITSAAERITSETGSGVIAISGDIGRPDTPNQIVKQTIEQYGALDILVTNAGGPPSGSFEQFTDQQWQEAINLSFFSHLRLIRGALPYLKKSKNASVLTITSYAVKQPIPNLILSNSIRAATVGLTKSLALELGNEGIRFNSILPGWTKTDRVNQLMSDRAKMNQTSIEEEIQLQSASSPLGRMATPEEFAKAAVFLVSPAASYITGVMLTVDGGMYKGIW